MRRRELGGEVRGAGISGGLHQGERVPRLDRREHCVISKLVNAHDLSM